VQRPSPRVPTPFQNLEAFWWSPIPTMTSARPGPNVCVWFVCWLLAVHWQELGQSSAFHVVELPHSTSKNIKFGNFQCLMSRPSLWLYTTVCCSCGFGIPVVGMARTRQHLNSISCPYSRRREGCVGGSTWSADPCIQRVQASSSASSRTAHSEPWPLIIEPLIR
jgi:hypothetical protein